MANDYHKPHEVVKGNPKVDGPYLDDILADQERAYREHRNRSVSTPVAEENVSGGDSVEVTVADAQPGLFDETESNEDE